MKNYIAAKWKSLRAWSSATWAQGQMGKTRVILAWSALVLVATAPFTWHISSLELELELRPALKEPALLCSQQQSFDAIMDAEDVTNQALMENYRHQPEILAGIISSDSFTRRDATALRLEILRKIAQGHCLEVTHGDPVKVNWTDWPSSDQAQPFSEPLRVQVTYQGQRYWTYAGSWQKATGKAVAEQDRAPLQVARIAPEGRTQSPPSNAESAAQVQPTPKLSPVPPFARGESYAQVRVVLMRDGWQPLISEDADKCMEDDSRCQGRPEMQSCSGSGLAMCRFTWQREGQRLAVCTAGENEAKFYSVCE
ncbi:MAG: hypothetical protein IV088_01925 [Hydrogenophaga sp.]|uniref:hypothetical protein n=1 Tax=Hydrogenophaga sp. TaxID=1904254 RepID=UPI0025C2167C|nr:hypothetical protein [Hydrogenophaga sp.]MBT9549581.1 hypothetical protein [Hydrogenophaga sp.]